MDTSGRVTGSELRETWAEAPAEKRSPPLNMLLEAPPDVADMVLACAEISCCRCAFSLSSRRRRSRISFSRAESEVEAEAEAEAEAEEPRRTFPRKDILETHFAV